MTSALLSHSVSNPAGAVFEAYASLGNFCPLPWYRAALEVCFAPFLSSDQGTGIEDDEGCRPEPKAPPTARESRRRNLWGI